MQIHRKIQLTAAAVIANGALALILSALTLNSQPAYAGPTICNGETCQEPRVMALELCKNNGGLAQFICPWSGSLFYAYFECGNGNQGELACI
jgi:hypothetical protein